MHTSKRKQVDMDYALILIGYKVNCLYGSPFLGAGSRPANKRDRPVQFIFNNLCNADFARIRRFCVFVYQMSTKAK